MLEIPDLKYTVKKINENYDSTDFIIDISKKIEKDSSKEEVYRYFSDVYDELFTNLLLKKTFVSASTKKLLEKLSIPNKKI